MQCGNPSETREEIKESSGMKQILNQKLTLTKDVAQADVVAGRIAQSLGELCVFWEDSQAHPTRKSTDPLAQTLSQGMHTAHVLGPRRNCHGPEGNTAPKLIPLTTRRWEETHGAKPSGFSQPCAGHLPGGHNHVALVQSPSAQHTPMRGTVLNKRETEAQRPAPRAPRLQPHPQHLQQSEELCSAFRRPHPPLQPQNQPSSPGCLPSHSQLIS